MIKETYYTIGKEGKAEFKDRGSRFVAIVLPIISTDECKERLYDIKKAHPKATHHCFAYRLGLDGLQFRAIIPEGSTPVTWISAVPSDLIFKAALAG